MSPMNPPMEEKILFHQSGFSLWHAVFGCGPSHSPLGVAAPAISVCQGADISLFVLSLSSRLLYRSDHSEMLTVSCCTERPVRGSHSVFKGPKSCRKTVFLPLLSGMYGEISDLAALTAHRKLGPDRNRMWNNRSSHPWV